MIGGSAVHFEQDRPPEVPIDIEVIERELQGVPEVDSLERQAQERVQQVQEDGIFYAERVAKSHGSTVPKAARIQLEQLGSASKAAFLRFKEILHKTKSYEQENIELALRMSLRSDRDYNLSDLTNETEQMRGIMRMDPGAGMKLAERKGGNVHIRLALYEAGAQIIAETDPARALALFSRAKALSNKRDAMHTRAIKRAEKNNGHCPHLCVYDPAYYRQNTGKEFLLKKVVTDKNALAILQAIDKGELHFRFGEKAELYEKEEKYLYFCAIRQAAKEENCELVLNLLEKIGYDIHINSESEEQKLVRVIVELFLDYINKQEINAKNSGEVLRQAYCVRELGYYQTEKSQEYMVSQGTVSFMSDRVTKSQDRELGHFIQARKKELAGDELLILSQSVKGQARDRMVEDWAIQQAPKNIDRVLEVWDQRYAQERGILQYADVIEDWKARKLNEDELNYAWWNFFDNKDPKYRETYHRFRKVGVFCNTYEQAKLYKKLLLVRLLGVVDNVQDANKLRQRIAQGFKTAEEYDKFVNTAVTGDARMHYDPALAVRILDQCPTVENQLYWKAVFVGEMMKDDLDKAISLGIDILESDTGEKQYYRSTAEPIIKGLAAVAPESAIVVARDHVHYAYESGNQKWSKIMGWIINEMPAHKAVAVLRQLVESGIDDGIEGFINNEFIIDSSGYKFIEQIKQLAGEIHKIGGIAYEIFVERLVGVDYLVAWDILEMADKTVQDEYLHKLKGSFMPAVGLTEEQPLDSIGDIENLREVLNDPRVPEIYAAYQSVEKNNWRYEYNPNGHGITAAVLKQPHLRDSLFNLALEVSKRDSGVDKGIIARYLIKNSEHADEVVKMFENPNFKTIIAEWGDGVAQHIFNKSERLFEEQELVFAFFKDPALEEAKQNIGQELCAAFIMQMITNWSGLPDIATQKGSLARINSIGFRKIATHFPKYAKNFIERLGVYNNNKHDAMLSVAGQASDRVVLFAEISTVFDPNLENIPSNFTQAELEKLAEAVSNMGHLEWSTVARIPLENWEERKKAISKSAEKLLSAYPGSSVVKWSLERSLRSKNDFEQNRAHIDKMDNRLRSAWSNQRWINGVNFESTDLVVSAILKAQEGIANKNLRNRMESEFDHRPAGPSLITPEVVEQSPQRMHASLGLLDRRYRVGAEMIKRLGETWYSGNILKQQTKLDRFNYFLLEGADASDDLKIFLELSVELAEKSKETKKLLFDLTQILRSLNFMEGDMASRLYQINLILRSAVAQIRATPSEAEMKNPADRAKFEKQEANKLEDVLAEVHSGLSQELVRVFSEKSGVAFTKEEALKFLEKFEEPGLIFIYLGKLAEYPHQKQLFQKFISGVAKGNFPEMRYTLERRHLDVVFKGREKDEEIWKNNLTLKKIANAEGSKEATLRKRIDDIIDGVLVDHHMPAQLHNSIQEFTRSNTEQRSIILARTQFEISNLKVAIKMADPKIGGKVRSGLDKDKLQDVQYIEMAYTAKGMPSLGQSLQSLENAFGLMQLIQATPEQLAIGYIPNPKGKAKDKDIDVQELVAEIRSRMPDKHEAFKNDLVGIANELKVKTEEKENFGGMLIVEESDDPDLNLRLGTDVESSCQNVNGQPSLNRNLVSYIMDGKTKVLFVRDADGGIVGRSIMRLLYDETEKKPVIHLERSYHRSGSPVKTVNRLLLNLAIAKSAELQYPLVTSGRFDEKGGHEYVQYPNDIVSYGGPGDTEYVDNLGGSQNGQSYTIGKSNISQIIL